jgi:hypothetical protein
MCYFIDCKYVIRCFAPTLLLLSSYFAPTLPLPNANDITGKQNDKAGIALKFSREFGD